MGMTNEQFASFRREQLANFERISDLAKQTNADERVLKELEKEIEKAKKDTEK